LVSFPNVACAEIVQRCTNNGRDDLLRHLASCLGVRRDPEWRSAQLVLFRGCQGGS
jgi:hypothetical protein